ncbi:MAG TPA: M56 family metallopeptidase [Thermoanaerobaculia bacterium]|nr:M56 family metallopeptidase [Thermoanaerobaculia bacterium]
MSLFLDAVWKGSLLAAIALCVVTIGRDRIPPKWRHALLLIALIRFALPFSMSSPFSIFNLTQRDTEPVTFAAPAPAAAIERVHTQTLALPRMTRTRVPSALFGIWAAGALLCLVREAIRIVRMRRRLRRGSPAPITDPSFLDALDSAREVLGVRRPIALATSDAVSTPSLLGIIHPTLLLPRDAPFSAGQLRYVFLHEVAHLRRLDVLVNWFNASLQVVHWFNPLVWFAVSRIAEERELACDALALEQLTRSERSGYAETVIELLERTPALGPAPALVAMTSSKHQLKRRIVMIANFRSHSRRGAWPAALVLAFGLAALTDARAGEHPPLMLERHPLSPAAAAVMQQLDQNVSLTLRDVPLTEVLDTIQRATGVTINVAKDALDDAKQQARIDLNADRVPAHMVLMESLSSLGLSLDFDEKGVTVVNHPAEFFETAVPPPPGADGGRDVVFFQKLSHTDDSGVTHRKMTLRGGHEGQTDGTLELEVRRAPASDAR